MDSEQLLLSYTYFINADHTKYISIGYSAETFAPCVIINYIGNAHTKLGLIEWLDVFMVKNEEISTFFKNCETSKCRKIKTIKNSQILFDYGTKSLILNNLAINHQEWILIQQMTDYIQSVLYWCKHLTRAVSSYYTEYVKRCVENNVYNLDATQFFTDETPLIKFNFSRLFWEMPILCKNKLFNDINILMYGDHSDCQ